MLRETICALFFLLLPCGLPAQQVVHIRVHVNEVVGSFRPLWAYVGHDEPNYTYSPEGRQLLSELSTLSPYPFHDRTHNLLTTGDGTPALKWGSTNVYTETASGMPVYNWEILDRIFDTYQDLGITPYVEIGFMPEALSSHPHPYRDHWPKGPLFTGWSYPPTDYNKWSELIYRWVLHEVKRYGRKTVASWDWEVWNEPNIGYWHGTLQQYCKLYDYTAAAVKRALPGGLVGGPATTGPASPQAAQFLRGFLTHCVSGRNYATGKRGSPLDFVSFHAKGRTSFVQGHVEMDVRRNLEDVSHGFAIVTAFPTLRKLPIVISESDPEGCAACVATTHPQNGYRNTSQYATYEAELLAATLALAQRYHVKLEGSVTWAFTFPGQPYFAGYRSLATHGIDKPVMNAFRMFGLMGEQRVRAESSGELSLGELLRASARARPDIGVIATRRDNEVSILVWNYDDDAAGSMPVHITLDVGGLPRAIGRVLITQFRIDGNFSNSCAVWKSMGSQQNPSPSQIVTLKRAGRLQLLTSPEWSKVESGKVGLGFALPRQGLSLIRIGLVD
jgi:xylan 1,4-beta-xylosidase